MNVQIVKLITGDEIIADVQDTTSDKVLLVKPVVFVPTSRGVTGIPYPRFGNEEPLEISRDFILFITKPSVEAEKGYSQYYTGIALPPAKTLEIPG
jgi:hypothetical protein